MYTYKQAHDCIFVKMLYLIGPDGLINQGYPYFQKLVWTTMIHALRILGCILSLPTLGAYLV